MRARSLCPCCGSLLTSCPVKVPGGLSEASSYEDIKATWIGVGKSKHFEYHKCTSCGTLSTLYYPEESLLAELYKAMPPNMEESVDEADQFRNQYAYARHIVNTLRGNCQISLDQVRFLELGADRGLLAKAVAQSLGYKLRKAVAIEPNQEVWSALATAFQHSSQVSQIYSSLDEMLPDETDMLEKYDVIAAIHVLDHTYDPFATLQALEPLLSEHGIIYFVVHNPKSSVARILGTKWPAFCAQHPQLFTPLGIATIARNLGFKVVRQGRTTNHFSLAMLTGFLGLKIPFANQVKLKAPLGNRYYCLQRLACQ